MDREYNALVKRNTWSYVKPQHGVKHVLCTWEFKKKTLNAEGPKFLEKARCCLRDDQQLAYVDYDPKNLYAPVASHDAIRFLLAMTAAENSILKGVDVSNAYLYGDMDIPIIMHHPRTPRKLKPNQYTIVKLTNLFMALDKRKKFGDLSLIRL